MTVRTILAILLLAGGLTGSLHAQSQSSYRFEHLSVREGLRGNEVTAILQDRKGFIWIGTSGGLSRYDGYHVTTYTLDPDTPRSLNHNWVLDLHQDRTGTLWIGTGGGLCRFDDATETFTCYEHDPNNLYSIGPGWVTTIYEDRDGALWVGTRGGGLNRFDPIAESFTRYTHDPNTRGSLSHNWVTFIDGDQTGALWVGTHGGLNRFDPATETFTRYTHDPDAPVSLSDNDVRTVLADQTGMVWVGTAGGLNRFDPATETFARYRHTPGDPTSLSDDLVHYLYEDRAGMLWIGTADGLNRFDPVTETFARYRHDESSPTSLSSNTIYSIYEDRQGVLWIGTADGGVNRLDPATSAFTHIARDPGDANSLSHNHVRALSVDREGVLWIGTRGGGLNRFDRATETFTHYRHDPRVANSLSSDEIEALYQDQEGRLWVGIYGSGLSRFDPFTETFTHYRHEGDSPASLASDEVYAIHRDRADRLWVGTTAGLSRFEAAAGTFTHFTQDGGGSGHLTSNAVYTITEDQKGQLWIGTERGLCRFDPSAGSGQAPATETFTCYAYDPEDDSSLSYGWVTSIYEDQQGALWIGTYGGGLNRFDPRSERFTRFTESSSDLPDNVVYCILGDQAGMLWMSTNQGLSRFDPGQEAFKNYDSGDGLQGEEFSRGACHRGRDGRLYFGGINGFNAFFPEEIEANPHPPAVVLTDFKLFNESVEPGPGSPLQKSIDETTTLTLAPWQDDVSFDYVGLHFSNPAKNQYAYMLEPYDETWREVGTQRRATYTNLDPGEYIFRVRAANSDGVWNEAGTSVRLTIQPSFYETRLFYVLCALAFVVLGLGIYRLRVRHLETQERVLRRQVRERTQTLKKEKEKTELALGEAEQARQEAEQARRTIEEQAQKLRALDEAKSRFFANLSHEFRTPLTLILDPLKRALSEDAVDGALRPLLQTAYHQARRLLDLIGQLLNLSRLDVGKMALQARRENLVTFLERVVRAFTTRAEQQHIDLQFHAERSDIDVYFDSEKLERVVNNLLSNAFKFTPEHGKIAVIVRLAADETTGDEEVCITIRDTGCGIPAEELPHLFDRFYQVDASLSRSHEGAGIGLSLARDLVDLHGGEITVRSQPGFGSAFTVHLPTGRAHLDARQIVQEDGPALHHDAARLPEATATPALPPQDQEDGGAMRLPTVLVVEDHAAMRDLLARSLTDGFHIETAQDGEEALEKARAAHPDLILSDVMMPGMDGYAFCSALKRDDALKDIPVILLTAKATEEGELEGFETGADAYVTKPFSAKVLRARIATLIEQRRALRRRYSRQVVLEPGDVVISSEDEAFLEKACAIVEDHMADERFTVEALADEIGLSRRHLYRRINDLTGQSPVAFIRSMRLQRAAELLAGRAGTVSEVAYAVGFGSASYFSKCFREFFGTPPSEYAAEE